MQLATPAKSVVVVLFLLLCAGFPGPRSFAAEGDAALSAPVTEIVGRLALRETPSAADYAELARATATYGERAKDTEQPAPESVIRDALAATTAGEALDPQAADWSALRGQLEALLPKDNPPPPDQQKSDDEKKPDQNKKDSSDDKNGEDGSEDSQQQDGSGKPKDEQKKNESGESKSTDEQQSADGEKPSDQDSSKPNSQKKSDSPGQSAFGEMSDETPPPPPPAGQAQSDEQHQSPPSDMQQVGGASTNASTDPARLDPSLTIPLQKLDQVKQGDSPAQLFQLLQGPSDQPAPTGKNW